MSASKILGRAYNVRIHKSDGSSDLLGYSLGLYWYLNEFGSLIIRCINQGVAADQIMRAYSPGTFAHVETI
jgi:hypothetical protein